MPKDEKTLGISPATESLKSRDIKTWDDAEKVHGDLVLEIQKLGEQASAVKAELEALSVLLSGVDRDADKTVLEKKLLEYKNKFERIVEKIERFKEEGEMVVPVVEQKETAVSLPPKSVEDHNPDAVEAGEDEAGVTPSVVSEAPTSESVPGVSADVFPEAEEADKMSVSQRIRGLANEIMDFDNGEPVDWGNGNYFRYIKAEDRDELLKKLVKLNLYIGKYPDEIAVINSREGEYDYLQSFLGKYRDRVIISIQYDAREKAVEDGKTFTSLADAWQEGKLRQTVDEQGRTMIVLKKGYEFIDPNDLYNFAVKRIGLLKRFGKSEPVGKYPPNIALPELSEAEVDEVEGIGPEQKRERETNREIDANIEELSRVVREFGLLSPVPFSTLSENGFSVQSLRGNEAGGTLGTRDLATLLEKIEDLRAKNYLIYIDPETQSIALKQPVESTADQLQQAGFVPLDLSGSSITNLDNIVKVLCDRKILFKITADGNFWLGGLADKLGDLGVLKEALKLAVEDKKRAEEEREEAEIPEHRGIVDIKESVLFEIVGEKNWQKLLFSFASPEARKDSEETIKHIFESEGVNIDALKKATKKAGYRTIEEFLAFWKEAQGYKETLHAMEQYVSQEERNVLVEMSKFYNAGATKVWERTKQIVLAAGPTAAVVGLVAVAGTVGKAPALVIRGVAGFIAGAFTASKTTKGGREKTKARANKAEENIKVKEEKVWTELRNTEEFRNRLLSRFGLFAGSGGSQGWADFDVSSILHHLSVFMSQGLAHSSYRIAREDQASDVAKADARFTGIGEDKRANAILIWQNGARQIAEEARGRAERGELNLEEANNARLNSLVAELYGSEGANALAEEIVKNPELLRALQTVMKIKSGDVLDLFKVKKTSKEDEEKEQQKEVIKILLGGLAGAAVGVASGLAPEVRAVVMGATFSMLGGSIMHIKDMKKREEAIRVELQKKIGDAESNLFNIHNGRDIEIQKSFLNKFATEIRITLSLGLLDNNVVLKYRALNALRSIERQKMEEELKDKKVEELLAALGEDLTALRTDREATLIKIKDKGGFIKRNVNVLIGSVVGAGVGATVGYFGGDVLHWLREKWGVVIPTAIASEREAVAVPESTGPTIEIPPEPSSVLGPESPDFTEQADLLRGKMDLFKEFRLSKEAVAEINAWTEKYPALNNVESLRGILVAATDDHSGNIDTLFPEAKFKDPMWILHFERERDLTMFNEILAKGGKEEALKFLENQNFNKVSLGNFSDKGKDLVGFIDRYQEEVLGKPMGERNGDLIKQLGRALQNDANRDDYLADNVNLFKQVGLDLNKTIPDIKYIPGQNATYIGMNEVGSDGNPDKFIATGIKGVSGELYDGSDDVKTLEYYERNQQARANYLRRLEELTEQRQAAIAAAEELAKNPPPVQNVEPVVPPVDMVAEMARATAYTDATVVGGALAGMAVVGRGGKRQRTKETSGVLENFTRPKIDRPTVTGGGGGGNGGGGEGSGGNTPTRGRDRGLGVPPGGGGGGVPETSTTRVGGVPKSTPAGTTTGNAETTVPASTESTPTANKTASADRGFDVKISKDEVTGAIKFETMFGEFSLNPDRDILDIDKLTISLEESRDIIFKEGKVPDLQGINTKLFNNWTIQFAQIEFARRMYEGISLGIKTTNIDAVRRSIQIEDMFLAEGQKIAKKIMRQLGGKKGNEAFNERIAYIYELDKKEDAGQQNQGRGQTDDREHAPANEAGNQTGGNKRGNKNNRDNQNRGGYNQGGNRSSQPRGGQGGGNASGSQGGNQGGGRPNQQPRGGNAPGGQGGNRGGGGGQRPPRP